MHLFDLLRVCCTTGSDGPYGLVSQRVFKFFIQLGESGFELATHHLEGLSRFSLLERFTDAKNRS